MAFEGFYIKDVCVSDVPGRHEIVCFVSQRRARVCVHPEISAQRPREKDVRERAEAVTQCSSSRTQVRTGPQCGRSRVHSVVLRSEFARRHRVRDVRGVAALGRFIFIEWLSSPLFYSREPG